MSDVEILCRNHGPYRVSGNFQLQDAKGKPFDLSGRSVIFLCRCGASQNKPFCDGAHNRIFFQSEIEARRLAPPAK